MTIETIRIMYLLCFNLCVKSSPYTELTQKIGISFYDFSRQVTYVIKNKNFKGKFKDLYNRFCKESSDELFDSKKEAIDFYSKAKNYKSLLKGEIGENLLAKYIAESLLAYEDILTVFFYVLSYMT